MQNNTPLPTKTSSFSESYLKKMKHCKKKRSGINRLRYVAAPQTRYKKAMLICQKKEANGTNFH